MQVSISKVFISTTVLANTPKGTVLSNTATTASAAADPNPANNSATATNTVDTSADLSITKDAHMDYTNPAPRVVYTIPGGFFQD